MSTKTSAGGESIEPATAAAPYEFSENQSNHETKAEGTDSVASGPLNPPAEGAVGEASVDKKETGWLVTSCDVGTAEPQSLSQELERLQVLKSYHIMDPERDEAIDRLTRLAGRVLDTPYTFLSLVDMGRIWFRANPDSDCETQLTRDILAALARVILNQNDVFAIPDINLDDMFRQGSDSSLNGNATSDSGTVKFRFFAGAPLMSPEGYRLGAICMLETEPRPEGITQKERDQLKDFAEVTVKTMVDRRKLTTQGEPSHLVACTAHDLITPLTGIQLSLSLLQQDGEFQAKLGEKRNEHISAAVQSSNMMLRICQSTIETLRGNRKLPAATDSWSLPRNLMQIAEASPFIDMKEFTANLVAISNSIPKNAKLEIILHPSAPTNIVSDGLKIFRSALNLLSNACSRSDSGTIVMTIFDDQDGSLVFECEDNGKEVEIRDSQGLFNQDSDTGNFGLYSVAYQINWLGGKYGIRRGTREESKLVDGSKRNGIHSTPITKGKGDNSDNAGHYRTIFWFSIPIVLPQDVSELMGLAKSLADRGDEASLPTFRADLPVTPPASPILGDNLLRQSPTIPEGIMKESETTRTWNALIIEDSTTVRKILGRALSKLGYQVFEAADGMEGLRELKANMFDMVLCDFLMPVMDGLDCVKQYREWEVTNRQVFRQYIVGISAHASRNDIERGLKLGMDDFKPKPIVLKTLTGLHDSAPLKEVRTTLDNLLNLPSLEVKRRPSAENFTIPPAAIKYEGDYRERQTSGSLYGLYETQEGEADDELNPRFAVPRRPSQLEMGKPPLFSIPPELTEGGRRSPKGKGSTAPLFSTPLNESSTGKQSPKPTPLFAIPASQSEPKQMSPKGNANPSPLFSIATKKDDTATKGPSPLFSIPTEVSEPSAGKKSPTGTGPPPLFSIATNLTNPSPAESQKRPALFALQNATHDSQNTKKPALFNIAGSTMLTDVNSAKQTSVEKDVATSDEKKPAPLFSINAATALSGGSQEAESKPPPLFALPNQSIQREGNTKNQAKNPALFSIPINPSSDASMTTRKTPLFDIPALSGDKNGQETGRPPKRPALFAIKAGPSDHVTGPNGAGSESTDGNSRPPKAMKRTLSSG